MMQSDMKHSSFLFANLLLCLLFVASIQHVQSAEVVYPPLGEYYITYTHTDGTIYYLKEEVTNNITHLTTATTDKSQATIFVLERNDTHETFKEAHSFQVKGTSRYLYCTSEDNPRTGIDKHRWYIYENTSLTGGNYDILSIDYLKYLSFNAIKTEFYMYAKSNSSRTSVSLTPVNPIPPFDIISWSQKEKPSLTFNPPANTAVVEASNNTETIQGISNPDGTFTITTPAEWACQTIIITAKDAQNNILKTASLQVPIIVETSQLTTEPPFTSDCSTCDVVVTKNAILTHDATTHHQIHDLYIEPGAQVILQQPFTVNSITLRSEGDLVPQLTFENLGDLTITQPYVKFTKRISNDRFYFFSLPFDCNLADITFSDGSACTMGTDLVIKTYDGEQRITNLGQHSNWKQVTNTLKAGKGYNIAVASPQQKEVVFFMPLRTTDSFKAPIAQVPVTAHGINAQVTDNHKGWNFVGNPSSASKPITEVALQYAEKMQNPLYLTIPDAGQDKTYSQVLVTEDASLSLPPFSGFFVQAAEDGNVVFPNPTTTRAVLRQTTDTYSVEKPIFVGLTLTDGNQKDETSFVISNQYTADYELGADLEKMIAFAQKPQIYIKDSLYRYAFKALPKQDATKNNTIGVYLPSQTTKQYTFSLMRNYDLSSLQAVYLTDKTRNRTVNLLQENYTFTSGYTYTNTRFSVSIVLKNQTTSLSSASIQWSVWQNNRQQMQLANLPIGNQISVYNMLGQLLFQQTISSAQLTLPLPAAGIYCVEVMGKNGTQAKQIQVY